LAESGVRFALRHRWTGWACDGSLTFTGSSGEAVAVHPEATILALGGASWPRLGSDGSWVGLLDSRGVAIAPLKPANCGFTAGWSDHFRDRFQGVPLKRIALAFGDHAARGEAVVTRDGIEGGTVYGLSALLREAILEEGSALVRVDLRPDLSTQALRERLAAPRGRQSTSTFLRKAAGLSPVAVALLREGAGGPPPADPDALSGLIKAVPVRLTGLCPLDRAISTAGGVSLDAVDESLMLRAVPGVFVAGEMLDWEAPTGGYLLQATFATGIAAANGTLAYLARVPPMPH
jgi:uncharacterized flavoprotein (TIGR03862 family)